MATNDGANVTDLIAEAIRKDARKSDTGRIGKRIDDRYFEPASNERRAHYRRFCAAVKRENKKLPPEKRISEKPKNLRRLFQEAELMRDQ